MPRKKRTVRPADPTAMLQERHPLPPGCQVRYFQEGDEAGMLECLQAAYGGWPRVEISVSPLDHLCWKLRTHEHALTSHIVAVRNGRFLAVRPLWGQYIKVDSEVLLARQAVDRAVVPEFQRTGMMTALEVRMPHTWHQRFEVTYSLRVNWQRINLTPGHNYIRAIDVVARALDVPAPQLDPVPDVQLRRISAFDGRFDALWEEASRPFRVVVARTSARLNYRFADRRAGNFRIVAAEQSGRLLGYVVTTSRSQVGYIADALVLTDRLDALEHLLLDAIQHLRAEGKTSVEFWRFPYHPYIRALQKLGFDEAKRTEGVNFRSLQGRDLEFAFFIDPKEPAHFTPGDTDLV